MSIQWDVSELVALANEFPREQNRVGRDVSQAIRESGKKVEDGAKQRSRVGVTGKLRDSWKSSASGSGNSAAMTVEVRSDLRYAYFHEHGTSKMSAQPMAEPSLDAETPAFVAKLEKIAGSFLE